MINIFQCRYEYFYGLIRDFPDLTFTINGGITSIDEVSCYLIVHSISLGVGIHYREIFCYKINFLHFYDHSKYITVFKVHIFMKHGH